MKKIKFLFPLFSALILNACASRNSEKVESAEAQPTAQALPAATPAPSQGAAHASSHHSSSHDEKPRVTAEQSLQWLKNGNIRYIKNTRRKDGARAADRVRLAAGQHPHAVVLSCSDSRVPPEHIFDQGLGEIFVVRVAGEALDSSVIASVEYAVEHLGPKLIVVMGHDSCGAVKAAYTTPRGQSAGSPSLDSLVADIQSRLGRAPASAAGPSANFVAESKLNASDVAVDLIARSPLIRQRVTAGDVKIVSSIYYLKNGKVEFLKQ